MSARWSISLVSVWLCALLGGLLLWSAPALAQREHAFSDAFGSATSTLADPEPLSQPGGVAVNESTGDVYVLDRGNNRVEIFSSTGAYVGQFNGSSTPSGTFSWPASSLGNLESEGTGSAIVVDNSTNPLDPSKGDVYVLNSGYNLVDKFTSTGVYLGQITGTSPASPFPGPQRTQGAQAVAVDQNGAIWVQVGATQTILDEFNDASINEYVSLVKLKLRTEGGQTPGVPPGLVFNSEGSFYMGLENYDAQRLADPAEFSAAGNPIFEELDSGEEATGLTVDSSSDDLYVDNEASIAAYGPSGSLIERFGSPELSAGRGLVVDSATGTVYAANDSTQEVDAFAAFVIPDASPGSASNFGETSVTVGATVNPDGVPVTACEFEYGTSLAYGQSVPCSPSPGSGERPEAVSAELVGLEQLTEYHFRLKVANEHGSNDGEDRTFVTPEPVVLAEESVSDVSSASALFGGEVDPGGSPTTYRFEYGTSESYGASVPASGGEVGPQTSRVPVSARVEGLAVGTTYHVRLEASNVLGTVYGRDEVFTTQAGGGAFALPDDRVWEMVSPPNKGGAIISPLEAGAIQASTDGSAVTYYATGPFGSNTVGNPTPTGEAQVLSRRGAGGWSSEDINPPNTRVTKDTFGGEYSEFSSDLSLAVAEPNDETPLSPETTETTPYLRDNESGSYRPLVTASNVTPPGTPFASSTEQDLFPHVVAATADLSHIVLASPDALAKGANAGSTNLYEWSEGRLQLVSELPGGEPNTQAARLGSLDVYDTRNALSSDGSMVFFSSELGLYARNAVTKKTVQVNLPVPGVPPPPQAEADYQIASTDGSKVFFLDDEPLTPESKLGDVPLGANGYKDLYVYDTVTGSLTDLSVDQNTAEAANAQETVVGASEDGSVVYFVATGKLAPGAVSGAYNLYVVSETGASWSSPRLVAVLSEADSRDWAGTYGSGHGANGRLYFLSSRVSPDGRYVAFMSDADLKTTNFPEGYDTRDAVSGQPDEEAFLYDEATGSLRCVSCNPTGQRPEGIFDEGNGGPRGSSGRNLFDPEGIWEDRWVAANIPAWTDVGTRDAGLQVNVSYQSRVLSDEGRMFFDSTDALVPQDTNGTTDVYEYEPQGVGSCVRAGGCLRLISPGTSPEESVFLDASAKGPGGGESEDVFFITAASLVRRDVDTAYDVYDAHMCSTAVPCMSAPVSPPPCTSGDACKAAPSPQPALFGAPSSATFSGAGNVTPSVPVPVVTHKKLTRAQKLAAALGACKVKSKKQRAACKLRARKRYGVAGTQKAKSLTGKGRR
jgi:DNA-binding beta-propeller fold protein YncE